MSEHGGGHEKKSHGPKHSEALEAAKGLIRIGSVGLLSMSALYGGIAALTKVGVILPSMMVFWPFGIAMGVAYALTSMGGGKQKASAGHH